LSNPYRIEEVGYYIPKATPRSYPIEEGQPVVIQINDVDIDHRGLAYASDRAGGGLFILEYTGGKKP
jgi:predicted RNA-binding protein with TRAM domain